jgi:NAD(P)-dependent dehydrogenase (short-subunit alcohol dehydrogenase family)
VLAVTGDVTRSADLQRLVKETCERFGTVDIVVPNAGMAKVVSFADSTEEAIHEQFSVNFVFPTARSATATRSRSAT